MHELPFGRTTIGSSAKCTVRLERPGVEPLHCLIVHGAEGTSIRRWAGDVQLNGVSCTESPFGVGDCLRIGSVEIEVVEPRAAQPTRAVAPISESIPVGPVSAEQDQVPPNSLEVPEAPQKSNLACETLRQQVADLQEENLQIAMERESVSGTLARGLAELAANRLQLAELNAQANERQQLIEQNQRLEVEIREASARASESAREQAESTKDHRKLVDDHAALCKDHQQLLDHNLRLQNEARQIAAESAAYRGEKDEVRGQNECLQSELQALAAENASYAVERSTLQGELAAIRRDKERMEVETTALAAEMAAIAEERSALATERGELQEHVAALEAHIAQLDGDYSALAVAKLTTLEECDLLRQQNEQLRAQIVEFDNANSSLTAAKATLSDEVARLTCEQRRTDELERQIAEERTGRENTSAELYRALIQLSELKERDDRYETAMSAYQSLTEERAQLLDEVERLRNQLQRLNAERAADESTRQAIVDEAEALREAQQRLADENSSLQFKLAEFQELLSDAGQAQIAGANAIAELERQLVAKQQAASAAATTVGDLERQLADQAHQFAETTAELEQRLVAADNAQKLLGQGCDEWRQHCVQAEHENAKQTARIADLEKQVFTAEDWVQSLSAQVASLLEMKSESRPVEQAQSTPLAAESPYESSELGCGQPSTVEGPDTALAAIAPETPPVVSSLAPTSPPSAYVEPDIGELFLAEALFADADKSPKSCDTDPWRMPTRESDLLGRTSEPAGEWTPSDGESPWHVASQAAKAAGLGGETKTPATSFIEGYSNVIEEGAGGDAELMQLPQRPTEADGSAAEPRAIGLERDGGVRAAVSHNDEEESIEQYMVKLMQRVRGESPTSEITLVVAEQRPERPVVTKAPPYGNFAGNAGSSATNLTAGGTSDLKADEGDSSSAEVAVDWEAIARRATVAAPKADMGALRALANESARRAIGWSELRRHRKDAVTKVIVSTLAGVTSLWLMLESPNWHNIEFVTACVSLAAAAYWAAATCRKMLESWKAAAYGGPETANGDTELDAEHELPVDVDEV